MLQFASARTDLVMSSMETHHEQAIAIEKTVENPRMVWPGFQDGVAMNFSQSNFII